MGCAASKMPFWSAQQRTLPFAGLALEGVMVKCIWLGEWGSIGALTNSEDCHQTAGFVAIQQGNAADVFTPSSGAECLPIGY